MSKNILTNQLNYFKYTLITLVLRWLSRFHCIHLVLTFFVYKFTVIKSVSYKYGMALKMHISKIMAIDTFLFPTMYTLATHLLKLVY